MYTVGNSESSTSSVLHIRKTLRGPGSITKLPDHPVQADYKVQEHNEFYQHKAYICQLQQRFSISITSSSLSSQKKPHELVKHVVNYSP